jgi:hypothetical protein
MSNSKSLLEEEIDKFEDDWLKLLSSTLPILEELLKTGTLTYAVKEHVDRQTPIVSQIIDIDYSFYSWIIRHQDAIKILAEFERCVNAMKSHEILGKYIGYIKTILLIFISECWSNSKRQNFKNIYISYMKALFSPIDEFIIICPLFNFDSEKELLIDDRLVIRRLKEEELDDLWNASSHVFEDIRLSLREVKFVIECRIIKPRLNLPAYCNPDDPLIEACILSLRLLKKGAILGGINFSIDPQPWHFKMGSARRKHYGIIPHGDKYILKIDEITHLKKIYLICKSVLKSDFLNRYKYLSTAIKWFNKSYNEKDGENKFIWLIFLVEALCSEIGDTKYKISNRLAVCIGKDDFEKIIVKERFLEIYRNPRNIVHGETVDIKNDDVVLLEDYDRNFLRSFISICVNFYDTNRSCTVISARKTTL